MQWWYLEDTVVKYLRPFCGQFHLERTVVRTQRRQCAECENFALGIVSVSVFVLIILMRISLDLYEHLLRVLNHLFWAEHSKNCWMQPDKSYSISGAVQKWPQVHLLYCDNPNMFRKIQITFVLRVRLGPQTPLSKCFGGERTFLFYFYTPGSCYWWRGLNNVGRVRWGRFKCYMVFETFPEVVLVVVVVVW